MIGFWLFLELAVAAFCFLVLAATDPGDHE